jgi:hypothetical protein
MQENNFHSKLGARHPPRRRDSNVRKATAAGPRLGDRADSSCKREILRVNSKSKTNVRKAESSIRRGCKQINSKGENMKLSSETKVGMAVASIFTALTTGVMGQGQSGGQSGGPNNYGPTKNPSVNTHVSDQGYNSSLPGRTNAEENRTKFSDENETITPKKAKRAKA